MRFGVVTITMMLLLTSDVCAHEGWGIVNHRRLGVVFTDIPGNTIWHVVDGRLEPLLRNVHSHELVADGHDAIYGTNPEPSGRVSSVWRVDARGQFSYVVSPTSDFPLGLQSFLITQDGVIYSANRYDHRQPSVVLLRRELDGRISALAGQSTGFADGKGVAARFRAIDGMRETPLGELVLADGAYLRLVTKEGLVRTLTQPLTRRSWGEDLLGVSSIHGGVVHVADHAGRRVLRVALATGRAQKVYKSSSLWAPAGVETADGKLYVLEHLRPPLSMLGDLQVGPYLRLRRVSGGAGVTVGVVWGRHSATVGATLLAFALFVVSVVTMLWRRRSRLKAG